MNDHSSDSYHPNDSGDHSKLCILGAEGSMICGRSSGALFSQTERNVRIV
jgi:hypothetical protein